MDRRVTCQVDVPDTLGVGEGANAFRIIPDGSEFLLDFLACSEDEGSVVTRIRVHRDFLPAVRDRVGSLLAAG